MFSFLLSPVAISQFDCKITNFLPRARAHSRGKCVKIDVFSGFVALKGYKRRYFAG